MTVMIVVKAKAAAGCPGIPQLLLLMRKNDKKAPVR